MSIEKFKSTYKEFSRQNRFEVIIPGFPPETTMACMSANLPGLAFGTAPARWLTEGVTAVPYEAPYDITDNPVNLIFLVDSDCSIMRPITAWMDEVYEQEKGFGYLDTYGRQVEIYQLNRHGDRVFGIKLDKAWPKNFGDLAFSSADGAPTTVSLSLTYGKFYYQALNPLTTVSVTGKRRFDGTDTGRGVKSASGRSDLIDLPEPEEPTGKPRIFGL